MALRFFLAIYILSSVACLQGRKSRVNPNQEGKLVPIKELVNLECRLETGDRKDHKVPFTKARAFNLERKQKKGIYTDASEEAVVYKYKDPESEKEKEGWLNNLGYVIPEKLEAAGASPPDRNVSCTNFESILKLPFLRAKSNHSYTVRFQVAGNFVRVLLVAPPKDMPTSSLPYSLRLTDNFYAMPIGGYQATAVNMEAVKNADWEDTNIDIGRPLPLTHQSGFEEVTSANGIPHSYLKGTDTVLFTTSEFQPYKSLVEKNGKIDVYPKDFFKGDWFYAMTPVTASSKGILGGGVGQHWISMDNEGLIAPAVYFKFQEKYLVAYNVNKESSDIPENRVSAKDSDRWVFQIPIHHLDYISKESGTHRNVGLQETENKDTSDHLKPWARLNFNKVTMAIEERAPFLKSKAGYLLEELTFSSDYFSFLIKDENKNRTMRFALLKKPENGNSYSPIYLTEDMLNLFPPYTAYRRIKMEDWILKNKTYQEMLPVERFNIQEPVRYHFSHLTPPEGDSVRQVGKESINIWNQVFKKAGVTCPPEGCFVLGKKDVPLGDIRYNVFNLIDPKEPLDTIPGLAGFGPSMSNYETGEIISATTNVYTPGLRRRIINFIKNYIQRETDMAIPLRERAFRNELSSITSNLWTGLYKEKLFLSKQIVSFFNFFKSDQADFLSNNDSPDIRIYGLQQNSEGFPELITSLKEAVSPEEKERISLHYRLITGREPPEQLKDIYETLEKFNKEEGTLRSCHLQEQRAEEELMGERVYSLIEALCSNNLSLIPRLKGKNIQELSPHLQKEIWEAEFRLSDTAEEKNITAVGEEIYQCADKILPLMAIGTTLHEQGHNIAMRHNFKGSADKLNFLTNEDFSHDFIFSHLTEQEEDLALNLLKPDSSTVMDYLVDDVISPGDFDVAFVRFYYGQKLQKLDGNIEKVANFADPIDRHSLRPYMACEDLAGKPSFWKDDIFCNTHDKGTTVNEIVANYHNWYIKQPLTFSYNRVFPQGRLRVVRFFFRTLNIYHQWRRKSAEAVDLNISESSLALLKMPYKEYVEKIYPQIMIPECSGYDPLKLNEKILLENCLCSSESLNSEETNKQLRELYCARTKITRTFKDVLFGIPNHYCIAENPTGYDELIPFRDIHAKLTASERFSQNVSSCQDVKDEFAKANWKLKDEIGYPLFSRKFSVYKNHQGRDSFINYRGIFVERLLAGLAFIVGIHSKMPGEDNPETLQPLSLMDEPDIRGNTQLFLKDRITEGLAQPSLTKYDAEGNPHVYTKVNSIGLEGGNFHLYNFSSEQLLWQLLTMPLLSSLERASNIVDHRTNFISFLGIVRPINSLVSNWATRSAAFKFLKLLTWKRGAGAYIYNRENRGSFVIFPSGYVHFMTESLSSTDIVSSFKDFNDSFLKWLEAEAPFSTEKEIEPVKVTNMNQFVSLRADFIQNKVLKPVEELLSPINIDINRETHFLLTYTLLFDYLVNNTVNFEENPSIQPHLKPSKLKTYFLTDYLVEALQAGMVMEYRIKEELGQENLPQGNIAIFRLPQKQDLDIIFHHYFSASQTETAIETMKSLSALNRQHYWAASRYHSNSPFNLFQPYFTKLKSYYEIHNKKALEFAPEKLKKIRSHDKAVEWEAMKNESKFDKKKFKALIPKLYALEIFKPGYMFKPSKMKEEMEGLLRTLYGEAAAEKQIQEAEILTERVQSLEVLNYFTNDHFLRDLFFITLFNNPFISDNKREIIIDLVEFLNEFDVDVEPISGLKNSSLDSDSEFDPLKLDPNLKDMPYTISRYYNKFNNFMRLINIPMLDDDQTSTTDTESLEPVNEEVSDHNSKLSEIDKIINSPELSEIDKIINVSNKAVFNKYEELFVAKQNLLLTAVFTSQFEKDSANSKENPNNELAVLLQNRLQKETQAHRDILLNSFHPLLMLERRGEEIYSPTAD